jgi:hypothetical protein
LLGIHLPLLKATTATPSTTPTTTPTTTTATFKKESLKIVCQQRQRQRQQH